MKSLRFKTTDNMYRLVKQTKKSGAGPSKLVRQSPRHQHRIKEQEIPQGRAMPFLLAYVCPLRHEVPKSQLLSKASYPIPLLPMFEDVEEEGSLLGHVNDLKFQDYNLLNHIQFLQFQVDQYMAMTVNPIIKVEALTPQAWIAPLQPSRLLNLLQIPHFGHSNEINAVVKVLLSCIHRGQLWLDHRVDITIDLIHRITGLSKTRADPVAHFVRKDQDKRLVARLIKNYNLTRGGRAYDVVQIEDKPLRFTVKLLVGHILRKIRPNQVSRLTIKLADTARDGVQYNWELYLLNQFTEDYIAAQDQNQPFQYVWLLILIGFVGWKEPKRGIFLNP